MVLVKVLGTIDIAAAIAFLMLTFGLSPGFQFTLFVAGLLLVKGLFILTGDLLSIIDLFSSLVLLVSMAFTIPVIILWIPAFLLLAKGFVSFL